MTTDANGHPIRPDPPIIIDGVGYVYDDNPTSDGVWGDPIVFLDMEDIP